MPQIRSYPSTNQLIATDAFVIDRIGTGTMNIQEQYFVPRLTTGTFGDSTHVAQITVNSQGSISAIANIAISSGLVVNRCLTYVIGGSGSVISTGVAGDLYIPFALTLSSVTLLADQTGSITLGVWSAPYGSFPPTSGNSIVAADPPTISSAVKSQDTSLTGWTTAIPAGNVLRFNVASVTSITRLTVAFQATG